MRKIIMFIAGIIAGTVISATGFETGQAETKEVIEISPVKVVTVEITEPEEEEVEIDDDVLELMARVVEAESGNQDLLGKRLVVDVILNRVDSSRFPNDIESVLRQSGQFTVVGSGAIYNVTPSEDTFKAIRMEIGRRTDTEILFFCASGYNSCCTPAYKHGAHYFGY